MLKQILFCFALTLVCVHADSVTSWNGLFISLMRLDQLQANPGASSRNGALLHLAIHDAVASITGDYERYIVRSHAPSTANIDAAVGAAAYNILIWLYPGQGSMIDQFHTAFMANISNSSSKQQGIDIGERAAEVIMALREMDGSVNSGSGYLYTNLTLHWKPDPTQTALQIAWGPGWGDIALFNKAKVSDFMVHPPPYTNTTEWATDYNQVKQYGKNDSTVRTSDQLQMGLFWAYDVFGYGPPLIMFNQILQRVGSYYTNTVSENAHMFALANMVMADAGIACWHFKYRYDLGRPVTVIRDSLSDSNPNTISDPTWTPYGAPGHSKPNFTPPFPSYPSGHATFGGALFKLLQLLFDTDSLHINLQSDELPSVTRTFTSFTQMMNENALSRVYIGVHYYFDSSEGVDLGQRIATYTFRRFLKEV